jgi:hypothetical protein
MRPTEQSTIHNYSYQLQFNERKDCAA